MAIKKPTKRFLTPDHSWRITRYGPLINTGHASWRVVEIHKDYILCHKWRGVDRNGEIYIPESTPWVKFTFKDPNVWRRHHNHWWDNREDYLAQQVALTW